MSNSNIKLRNHNNDYRTFGSVKEWNSPDWIKTNILPYKWFFHASGPGYREQLSELDYERSSATRPLNGRASQNEKNEDKAIKLWTPELFNSIWASTIPEDNALPSHIYYPIKEEIYFIPADSLKQFSFSKHNYRPSVDDERAESLTDITKDVQGLKSDLGERLRRIIFDNQDGKSSLYDCPVSEVNYHNTDNLNTRCMRFGRIQISGKKETKNEEKKNQSWFTSHRFNNLMGGRKKKKRRRTKRRKRKTKKRRRKRKRRTRKGGGVCEDTHKKCIEAAGKIYEYGQIRNPPKEASAEMINRVTKDQTSHCHKVLKGCRSRRSARAKELWQNRQKKMKPGEDKEATRLRQQVVLLKMRHVSREVIDKAIADYKKFLAKIDKRKL